METYTSRKEYLGGQLLFWEDQSNIGYFLRDEMLPPMCDYQENESGLQPTDSINIKIVSGMKLLSKHETAQNVWESTKNLSQLCSTSSFFCFPEFSCLQGFIFCRCNLHVRRSKQPRWWYLYGNNTSFVLGTQVKREAGNQENSWIHQIVYQTIQILHNIVPSFLVAKRR